MKIFVNDSSIKLYDIDTLVSFKNRIASILKVVPRYIEKITESDLKNKKISKDIILNENFDSSFKDFYDIVWNKYDIELDELVKIYYIKNEKRIQDDFFILLLEQELEDHFSKKYNDIITKKFKIENYKNDIENELNQIIEKVKIFDNDVGFLSNLELYPHFEFKKSKEYFKYKSSEFINYSIDYMFQHLKLNNENNYAILNSNGKIYYKYYTESVNQEKIDEEIILNCIYLYNTIIFIYNGYIYIKIKNNFTAIDKIINLFPELKLEMILDDIEDISGETIFKININTYILNEIITNNDHFSKYFSTVEKDKVSKKNSGLFIRIFNENFNIGKVTMIPKIANKTDKEIRNINRQDIPIGSAYLKFTILSINNNNNLNKIIEIVSKLFTYYNNNFNKYLKEYQNYIQDFKIKKELNIQKDFSLKDIKSDLFVNGYSRVCQSYKMLSVDNKNNNKNSLKFPKDSENSFTYSCSGNIPKYSNYKYIGMMENNKLSNKDKYPFIPCCYKDDHINNPNSLIYKYINDEEIYKNEKKGFKESDINLDDNIEGKLLYNLEKNLFYINPNFKYYRLGVKNNGELINSFLNCIKKVIRNFNYENENENFYNIISNCSNSIDKNILIFKKNNLNAYLEYIPNLYYDKNKSTILIYQHNKICELIFGINMESKKYFLFDTDFSKILIQEYIFTDKKLYKLKNIKLNQNFVKTIQIQELDIYNKVNRIKLNNGLVLVSMYPLMYIENKSIKVDKLNLCNNDDIINKNTDFINKYKISKNPNNIILNIDNNIFIIYKETKDMLNNFELNKLKAKILKEFFIFKFSDFSKNEDDKKNLKLIKNFVDSNTIIIENYQYDNVIQTPIFKDNEKYFIKDKKIIVNSKETLKKLIYYLFVILTNDFEMFKNYYLCKEINNYYESENDYLNNFEFNIISNHKLKPNNLNPILGTTFILKNNSVNIVSELDNDSDNDNVNHNGKGTDKDTDTDTDTDKDTDTDTDTDTDKDTDADSDSDE